MSKSEKEKMLSGEMYHANDSELLEMRLRARKLVKRINDSEPEDTELREQLFGQLFDSHGESLNIETPFRCDYGANIRLGDRVMINYGCVMLDVCAIRIGDDVFLGPNVQLYTAGHPLDWQLRKHEGPEFGKPISIGDDCWLGGCVIVCPGITIGPRSVIGAGSVVTKDIPPDSLAVGNPARIIKNISNHS